jgi:hypothetical protein
LTFILMLLRYQVIDSGAGTLRRVSVGSDVLFSATR